jgi:hypothetical protein
MVLAFPSIQIDDHRPLLILCGENDATDCAGSQALIPELRFTGLFAVQIVTSAMVTND